MDHFNFLMEYVKESKLEFIYIFFKWKLLNFEIYSFALTNARIPSDSQVLSQLFKREEIIDQLITETRRQYIPSISEP